MNKSVSEQLLTYLQENRGVFAKGTLQRMEWRNKNGTLATPVIVVRRLQELAEEGKINSTEIDGHTYYSADPIIKSPIKVPRVVLPDGQVVNVDTLD